ncbi:MAG: hypothetical protein ACFFE2_05030 [Candidatus Thorarchaeota archaeon]
MSRVSGYPEDISYNEGETGYQIVWFSFDLSLNYCNLYIDGGYTETHLWIEGENTTVVINVDGLPVGLHNYTIRVRDQLLLETLDTVFVSVRLPPASTATTPATTPTYPSGPQQLDPLRNAIILISVGSAAVIIVVVLLILKKRR